MSPESDPPAGAEGRAGRGGERAGGPGGAPPPRGVGSAVGLGGRAVAEAAGGSTVATHFSPVSESGGHPRQARLSNAPLGVSEWNTTACRFRGATRSPSHRL